MQSQHRVTLNGASHVFCLRVSMKMAKAKRSEVPSIAKGKAESGCLYVVATPIGNLEDISMRALRILKECDQIACEDTRHTLKLLSHFDIHTKLVSYHEHNELTRAPEIVIDLEQGASVALVSDAGMPAISDPGHRLVALCVRHGIKVVPVPGASAFVAALAASGLPSEEFTFFGFLPARSTERRKALRALIKEPRTLVFYEAPHRIQDTLEDALEILGNRPAVIAREITKLHEEFTHGHLADLVESSRAKPPRGEITLLIGAADPASVIASAQEGNNVAHMVPLAKRVEQLMREKSLDRKAALKEAARERGLTRREAYKQLLITRDE
jgi:16S rRNA (cytidine1402-2'-O)-methyltransferase